MTRYRPQYGQRSGRPARRGIGSYDSDWQRPLAGDKEVEIDCEVLRDNDRSDAILITDGKMVEKIDPETGEITEEQREAWIPRSKIIRKVPDGKTIKLTIPEWLAKDRGLI